MMMMMRLKGTEQHILLLLLLLLNALTRVGENKTRSNKPHAFRWSFNFLEPGRGLVPPQQLQ